MAEAISFVPFQLGTASPMGSARCTPCLPGSYGPTVARADKCIPCPVGTEQPTSGQSLCTDCPAGRSIAVFHVKHHLSPIFRSGTPAQRRRISGTTDVHAMWPRHH